MLWILNGAFALLIAFGGFVVKRIVHELDHSRTKIAELFATMTDIRIAVEKAKTENGRQFVTREDFTDFKTEIITRFDKSDEKLDRLLIEMSKPERERK